MYAKRIWEADEMEFAVNPGLAQRLSSPNPFALVTSWDGSKTNVMALSWWTYCSNHPLKVAVCIGNRSYSGDCIAENKEFCLCLPAEGLEKAAMEAGACSGRNRDKAAELGIALAPAAEVAPSYVEKSSLTLECRVKEMLSLGDHRMFIAEVAAMHTKEGLKNLMAADGYARLSAVELC